MINYNLRVLSESSRVLDFFVQSGLLQPVPEQVPGGSGKVYAIQGEQPEIRGHFDLRLGGKDIAAQLYALPPEEYAGMLSASPAFRQYDVAHLLPALSKPMHSAEKEAWLQSLMEAMKGDCRNENRPLLLTNRPIIPAEWHPEKTRFFRNAAGWFLSLFFEKATVLTTGGVERSAVGIDVGLNTLAVAVHSTGLIHRAAGITEICITATQLEQWFPGDRRAQQTLQQHLLLLQHAAARLELHEMVRLLLSTASYVYWENLRYADCSPAFARRSRELGIRDFLMCWLPKRLDAAGIRWQRVPPDHTSQYCHITHRKGVRDSSDHSRFTNTNGRVLDADVNAAFNIMAVGLAYRMERGL